MGRYVCECYVGGACAHAYRELIYENLSEGEGNQNEMNAQLAMSIRESDVGVVAL